MASKQVECPKCGTRNDASAATCSRCGVGLAWVLNHWAEYVSGPRKTHLPLLLISDPHAFKELYRLFFERLGVAYRLAEAHEGDAFETVELAKRLQPDLIIIDLLRPESMQGDELIRNLKATPYTQDIPILLVATSGSDYPGLVAALEAGATWYLPKPLTPQGLSSTVASILADGPAVWIIHANITREACRAMEDRNWRVWNYDLLSVVGDPVHVAMLLKPDVIAIDIHANQAVLSQLKANPDVCGIPVVILAEGPDNELERQALEAAGAHSVYSGPLDADRLLAAIQLASGKTASA